MLSTLLNNLTTDWKSILFSFLNSEKQIEEDLIKEYNLYEDVTPIYPPKNEIFNAFSFFDFSELNVIIIGQDPYHQPNQAHGLCFSIADSSINLPPSLRNIYKELETDINNGIEIQNRDGNFTHWAEQGRLLNNSLTVRQLIQLM